MERVSSQSQPWITFTGLTPINTQSTGSTRRFSRRVLSATWATRRSATLDIPIWNWGATRAKVKSAQLQRNQATVELSFAQRKMAADLKDFFSEAQTSRSELESLRQSADLAAESLRLTTLRYQAGEATVLEVVDSQNTLTQAQNALGDGQVRYRVAVASLQTLTGKF